MSDSKKHMFNILVCIDGSEEGYRGLHYAIKFSLDHPDTDIALLYVRSAGTEVDAHPASIWNFRAKPCSTGTWSFPA